MELQGDLEGPDNMGNWGILQHQGDLKPWGSLEVGGT